VKQRLFKLILYICIGPSNSCETSGLKNQGLLPLRGSETIKGIIEAAVESVVVVDESLVGGTN